MGKPKIILFPTSMLRKQAGQMRKLLGFWDKKGLQKETNSNPVPRPTLTQGHPDFFSNDKGLNTRYVTRRQIVLNRHFTEIISDVLANNLRKDLSDLGVQVTSIETKAWNKGVRVYYSVDNSFDVDIHEQLNSLITKLRSAVSERQLIGRTPLIHFVYDESSQLHRNLDGVLSQVTLNDPEEQTGLVNLASSSVQPSERKLCGEPEIISKQFFAPADMSNTTLGLNYTSLYNEVASKLERGRAQSSRIIDNVSLMSDKSMFRAPLENIEEDDPTQRVQNMQKFLISQRKKSEISAKLRRQKELLLRDLVKWDVPEEEEFMYDPSKDELSRDET